MKYFNFLLTTAISICVCVSNESFSMFADELAEQLVYSKKCLIEMPNYEGLNALWNKYELNDFAEKTKITEWLAGYKIDPLVIFVALNDFFELYNRILFKTPIKDRVQILKKTRTSISKFFDEILEINQFAKNDFLQDKEKPEKNIRTSHEFIVGDVCKVDVNLFEDIRYLRDGFEVRDTLRVCINDSASNIDCSIFNGIANLFDKPDILIQNESLIKYAGLCLKRARDLIEYLENKCSKDDLMYQLKPKCTGAFYLVENERTGERHYFPGLWLEKVDR